MRALEEMPFPVKACEPDPKKPDAPPKYVLGTLEIGRIVERDPHFHGFRYNVRMADVETPDANGLDTDLQISNYLGRRIGMRKTNGLVSKNTIEGRAWRQYTRLHKSFDPVQEYLTSLHWDGKKRLETWLFDLFDTPEAHPIEKEGWVKWMRSAVLRVMQPGCAVEGALVLVEERGGVGKTGFFNNLFPNTIQAYNISNPTHKLDHPDVIRKFHQSWCFLLEEIGAAYKFKAIEELKAFLTASRDTWRDYWQAGQRTEPRRTIIAGASNAFRIINDQAMSRRLFIVDVTPRLKGHVIPFDRLEAQRDQIWAEVMHWYRTTPEDQRQTDIFFGPRADDLRVHNIKYGYTPEEETDVVDFLTDKSGFIPNSQLKAICPRQDIRARALRDLGWKTVVKHVDGRTVRGYFRDET